jgi:hypothetical protein
MFFRIFSPALCLILAAIASIASAAVVDTINGVVSDSATNTPIDVATVASEGVSTSTNTTGAFRLILATTNIIAFEHPQNFPALVWHPENGSFSWNGYSDNVSVCVHNVRGEIVAKEASEKNDNFRFSISHLSQGMYIVTFDAKCESAQYKILHLGTSLANSCTIMSQNISASSSVGPAKALATGKSHVVTFTKTGYKIDSVTVPAGTQNSITVKLKASSNSDLVRIFDGRTLTGWVPVATNLWKVNTTDSAIQCTGAGRGYIYTTAKYLRYRVIYTIRSNSAGGHAPCILMFSQNVNADAMAAWQFQLPTRGSWDYRPGANYEGLQFLTKWPDPVTNIANWTQCEVLVDTRKGTAVAAVAQPPGTKATKIIAFSDTLVKTYNAAPFGIQAHNSGVTDEYKDIFIEDNPTVDSLITTR